MVIAIAGASGFIGKRLVERLRLNHQIVALTRSHKVAAGDEINIEWRTCDLYSEEQTTRALIGVDVAIYLIHSMLPTAKLTQASFEDLDLLLANQFARAAKEAQVSRILYLGGLMPEGQDISAHLRSRLETERTLSNHGVPVTTLRSGLILGEDGSSFQMLYLLVMRLPLMVCPSWTRNRTQCIGVNDVIGLIEFCIMHAETAGRTYDIGCQEVTTYQELMQLTARVLGIPRRFISVRFFSPGLSRLWVQIITGASSNLVRPLVESLRYEMLVKDRSLMNLYPHKLDSLETALKKCLEKISPTLRITTLARQSIANQKSDVRSIQRLPLTVDVSARWVANEYFLWLPKFLKPWIQLEISQGGAWNFRFPFFSKPLLILKESEQTETSESPVYRILGGLLVSKENNASARLQFHAVESESCVIAAIHDFHPSLPWVIYRYTQALIHLWVMGRFRRHLLRMK
jgi:uncharacterized protein YbjT (DUF2867 family)